MTVVMGLWWPVSRQIGLPGGRHVLVGAPSCPGIAMACQQLLVDGQSAIESSEKHTDLRL